jgi:uroporphyrinogen-III decarboxylase
MRRATMRSETMSATERMECAINLEKPDRVPIWPDVTTSAAAALTGQKNWEAAQQDFDAQQDIELKLFDDYGGWDGANPALTPEVFTAGGFKVKKPTEESPEIQFVESDYTKYEDYETIAEIGWLNFVKEDLVYRVSDIKTPDEYDRLFAEVISGTIRGISEYQKRGAFVLYPQPNNHPFFTLSLSRSMVRFTEDLFYRPDMVEKALAKMTEEFISFGLSLCKDTGIKIMKTVEERAGAFFYPLDIFERFWWPYTRQIVDAFWSEGIKISFHLDTCWDKNIPYFKQLPRASAILELDGTTDIFAAKEQLRNHLCIASDVHPTLMSLGKPEEVTAYCKRLIDEVGGDGGHILSTGCGLPAAAKKENFTAMLETGRTYELSK